MESMAMSLKAERTKRERDNNVISTDPFARYTDALIEKGEKGLVH